MKHCEEHQNLCQPGDGRTLQSTHLFYLSDLPILVLCAISEQLTDPRTKSDLRTIRDPRSILCDLGVLTAATGRVCSQLSQLCTDFVHGSVAPQLPPAKCDVYLMQQHANLGAPTESLNQSVSNQVYD